MNLQLGTNTPENHASKDFQIYIKSLELLRQRLIKQKPKTIFIVQSRKGPKLLEIILSEKERSSMNILTEHALPFLFPILAKDRSIKYNIVVIDDAVYYGTTLENLVSEIKDYASAFNVNIQIDIHTAIRTKEAKDIKGVDIHSYDNIRKGYGHYFVSMLLSDMRTLTSCMEVEFPLFTYKTPKRIEFKDFQSNLKKVFSERGRLYDVDQYASDTFHETGVRRFSILLNNDEGAIFSKMRFYVSDNAIRVVFISPHLIPNNNAAIEQIFAKGTDSLKTTWNTLFNIVNSDGIKVIYGGAMSRNRQRTLVVAANYLLSLNLFFKENASLQRIISTLCNDDTIEPTYDEAGLKSIFYDDIIVLNILSIMDEYKNSPANYLVNLYKYNHDPSRHQIFETTGYPPDSEKEKLQDFNARMLKNCQNKSEMLSALFFNQTTLVEKWSRQFGDNTSSRLRFGYNYEGLLSALESETLPYDRNLQTIDNNTLCEIHRWIDRRIDQGCVVPQYIVDTIKGHWDRVFRPGENEEAILSTLTRFVSCIIGIIKKEFHVQDIPEFVLKKILCFVVAEHTPILQDLLHIKMDVDGDGLKFMNDDMFVDDNSYRDVVDYLVSMLVLERKGNFIDISKRFVGTEQVTSTTFSYETRGTISSIIAQLKNELSSNRIDFFASYSLCNYHLRRFFSQGKLKDEVNKCIENLLHVIEILQKKKDVVERTTTARNDLFSAFNTTKCYIMPKILFEDSRIMSDLYEGENNYIYDYQRRFSRISFTINVILLIYYSTDSIRLKSYVHAIDDNYSMYLEATELLDSIKVALSKGKSVTQMSSDQGRLKDLHNYIEKTQ